MSNSESKDPAKHRVEIIFKSGQRVSFFCEKFTITESNNKIKDIHGAGIAGMNFIFLDSDDISAVIQHLDAKPD